MLSRLRIFYASIRMRFPFAPRRWDTYCAIHGPILAPAAQHNAYARLLVLRTLDAIYRRKLTHAAKKRLATLCRLLREDHPADGALYHFLCGMWDEASGDTDSMMWRFRRANEFGHTYHLIYVKQGLCYLRTRYNYDLAFSHLNKAIDCIYQYPPLDDAKRRLVALLQTHIARTLLMMHRTDEAEAMLTRSEAAADTPEYLEAQALAHALRGRALQAQEALDALHPLAEEIFQHCEENVRLILAGTHPHFTAREPDHEAIDAYWKWFVHAEGELLWNLRQDNRHPRQNRMACFTLHKPHFTPLAPEEHHIHTVSTGFTIKNGQPQFVVDDHHSRTYAARLDALISACPPELLSRWEIIRNPDSGDPQCTKNSSRSSTPPAASSSSAARA